MQLHKRGGGGIVRPFEEFRAWARRAPGSERAVSLVVAVVVAALAAWLLVPSEPESLRIEALVEGSTGEQTADEAIESARPGDDATPVTADASPGPSGRSPSGSPVPANGRGAVAGGCTTPPGQARGMTGSELRIAVGLSNIVGPAANELFGIARPEEQEAAFRAIIDDLNQHGGIACRQVVADYYLVNPADQAGMHQLCLEIADSGAYAVVDAGSFASITDEPLTCFAQHKVSYFGAYFISEALAREWYPYLFSFYTYEGIYWDTVFALKDLGFFDPANGFAKLGVLVRTCKQQTIDVFFDALAQAGIGDDDMVTYDVGCPTAFANPADLAQAVVTFQRAGVTHVTGAGIPGDFASFSNIAERQRFRPKYGLPDEALIAITYGSQRPDPDNIDGAIAITQSRLGEERTPGTVASAGTARCNAILESRGLRNAYEEPTVSGNACSQLWMFQAAVEQAPSVEQTALGVGLQRARTVEFSFPQGPNEFVGDKVTTGGQFWRPTRFFKACACWQVTDRAFRPTYR